MFFFKLNYNLLYKVYIQFLGSLLGIFDFKGCTYLRTGNYINKVNTIILKFAKYKSKNVMPK